MVVAKDNVMAATLACDSPSLLSSTERPSRSPSFQPQYRLHYSDDQVKNRCEAILRMTLLLAQDKDGNSSNAILAKKAMKYRKKDKFAHDYDGASWDPFQSFGIVWSKVTPAQAP
jgi:hypothetical protein